MRQSHLLFLATISAGLVLVGAGCSNIVPNIKTDSEVKTDTQVVPNSEDSAQKDNQKAKPKTPVKTTTPRKFVCTDTDGGNMSAVKGETTVKDPSGNVVSSKVDYCGDDAKVFEYYCAEAGNSIEATSIACGENKACVEGACVSASARLAMINGLCGSANGQQAVTPPASGLCSAGTPTAVTGNGPWAWTCAGINGGATASCAAPKYLMSGLCGSAHNTTVSSAPTANLCSRGTASAVTAPMTGQGWVWTCSGEEGAEIASCKALPVPLQVLNVTNGSCGSANNATLISAPTTNLCVTGTVSPVTGDGPWAWTCGGSGGGTTASCNANVRIEP